MERATDVVKQTFHLFRNLVQVFVLFQASLKKLINFYYDDFTWIRLILEAKCGHDLIHKCTEEIKTTLQPEHMSLQNFQLERLEIKHSNNFNSIVFPHNFVVSTLVPLLLADQYHAFQKIIENERRFMNRIVFSPLCLDFF